MRAPLAAVLALAALFVPACGGGDGDGGGRSVTVPGDAPVEISGDEYDFDPQHVTVTGAPTTLTIRFRNTGSIAHNVRVFQGDDELGGSPTFGGGQTREGTVNLPGPGEYRLVCTVGNHEDLGMTGTLTVVE